MGNKHRQKVSRHVKHAARHVHNVSHRVSKTINKVHNATNKVSKVVKTAHTLTNKHLPKVADHLADVSDKLQKAQEHVARVSEYSKKLLGTQNPTYVAPIDIPNNAKNMINKQTEKLVMAQHYMDQPLWKLKRDYPPELRTNPYHGTMFVPNPGKASGPFGPWGPVVGNPALVGGMNRGSIGPPALIGGMNRGSIGPTYRPSRVRMNNPSFGDIVKHVANIGAAASLFI